MSIRILSPSDGEIVQIANEFLQKISGEYTPGCGDNFSNGEDRFSMQGVTLKWTADSTFNAYMVCLSEEKDLEDGVKFQSQEPHLFLKELKVNTQYYWRISALNGEEVKQSPIYTFTTADTPRTIEIEGVSNTRDLGGKNLPGGRQIRQGMVYRGGKLDDVTQQGKHTAKLVYAIKTDLDLRNMAEGTAGQTSPLGEDINYVHINGAPYYLGGTVGIDVAENHLAITRAIKTFATSENYPIYVHCSLGRDRTAAVCLLLLGLLGASKRDIMIDYEVSFLSKMGSLDGQTATYMQGMFSKTFDYLATHADGDFSLACETYLLQAGVSADELAAIKKILIQ